MFMIHEEKEREKKTKDRKERERGRKKEKSSERRRNFFLPLLLLYHIIDTYAVYYFEYEWHNQV
jgi:hypothetical protein